MSNPQPRGRKVCPEESLAVRVRCRMALIAWWLLPSVCSTITGCSGPQSALDPAGRAASQISDLFWRMTIGGFVIWVIVTGLAVYAIRIAPRSHDPRLARLWILGGGTIVPTVVLSLLLVDGLSLLPDLVRAAPTGSLQIHVTGHQWWWRVQYGSEDGDGPELANEVRLPVGEPVQFQLQSHDVIHSFWIPALGGKVDMIPGRTTYLTLRPERTGTFRGVCAEFCGTSHALMLFDVVVMEQDEFAAWRDRERQSAVEPTSDDAQRGQQVFLSRGCSACHTIRGTAADGVVGPDLTHVAGRSRLAAGILANTPNELRQWIAHAESRKPDVRMPSFHDLTDSELQALEAYLGDLK